MAAYRSDGEVRAPSSAILTNIVALDTFARKLCRRARNAGSSLENATAAVRDLHTVLKHLKVEAEDPESLLNGDTNAVYIRQLTPIIEDSEFTLKQLDTILEKYFDYGSDGSGINGDGEPYILVNDSDKGWTMLDRNEVEKVDLIRNKLAGHRLHIHLFLDTIQLHNPNKSRQLVDPSNANLDAIKDKVDAIASHLCQRRNSGFGEDENQVWEQFQDALEEEGFSKDVLRKNQDVLRAYIRQIDEQFATCGGNTPSVRGLLENCPVPVDSNTIPPYPIYPGPAEYAEDDTYIPDINDEKFFPSMRMERLRQDNYPTPPAQLSSRGTGLSYDQSSDDQDTPSSGTMALISTRELMALDEQSNDIVCAMDNMRVHSLSSPKTQNYTTSSSLPQKYLPPSSSQPLLPSPDRTFALNQYESPHDPPPRYVPSLPPPPLGADRNSPPIVHSNSISAPSLAGELSMISPPILSQESIGKRVARLGPDGQGREIPLDAKWTRIRRSLVSPEVLAQEGLRYEARPDFVAILGELKKEDIARLARRSEEVRNGRRRTSLNAPVTSKQTGNNARERRPEDRYHPDKYRNWDVIEGRQDQNGGPGYVINPHNYNGARNGSTSELWDSSDDEAPGDGVTATRRPSAHPPLSEPRSPSYHRNPAPRRDSDQGGRSISGTDDSKGTKAYPFIVPSPTEEYKTGGREKPSTSTTIKPKPILKNKDDDPHVRFNPDPQILNDRSASYSRNSGRRDKGKDAAERDRDRDRDKVRIRDRDRDKKYRSDQYPERECERDHRSYGNSNGSSGNKQNATNGRRGDPDDYYNRRPREERERERERDRDRDRDRGNRKKARSETLRAVGIGGAAASLLSVLTEAAAGL